MPEYQHPFTQYIMADVSLGRLDAQRIVRMREDLTQEPAVDQAYLASLDEALSILLNLDEAMTHLLDAEAVMKHVRDREGQPAPDSEVE